MLRVHVINKDVREITEVETKMPQVTIRTTVDGREETLSEYLCDWSDCPNVAVEVIGVVRSLRLRAAVCAEHAALLQSRRSNNSQK